MTNESDRRHNGQGSRRTLSLATSRPRMLDSSQKRASTALLAEPSYWQLMLAVKDWAKAVAHKCRQCSREYAKLYADEPDPVMETIKTLLFVLCDHLRLPANPRVAGDRSAYPTG